MIDLEEFRVVLASSIRPNESIPFDCYIHLKAMGKFILWVQKGETFPEAKLDKLAKGNVDKVYFRNEDQEIYKKYLVDYFNTPEGKAQAQNLNYGGDATPGLAEAIDLGVIEDQGEAGNRIGTVEVKDDFIFGQVSVVNDPLEAAVAKLELELEKNDVSSDQAEAFIKIRSMTEKINEEMLKISGFSRPYSDQDKIKIKEATEIIKDEIVKVGPYVESIPERFRNTVNTYLDKIDKLILSENKKEGEMGVFGEHFTEIGSTGRDLAEYLDKTQKVSEAIETKKLINGLREIQKSGIPTAELSGNVQLDSFFSEKDISLDFIASHSPQHGQLIQKLKEMIRRQGSIIKGLNEKMSLARTGHEAIRSKWLVFETLVKRKLDMQDQQEARQINGLLRVFSSSYSDSITALKNVSEVSSELLGSVGIDFDSLEAELVQANSPDMSASELAELNEQSPNEEVEDEAILNSMDVEKLSSENEVLHIQLKNSQALLNDTSLKLEELEKSDKDRESYLKQVESTLEELKKQIEVQEIELKEWRSKESYFNEAMEKADTDIYKSRTENANVLQANDEVQLRFQQMHVELNYYREKLKELVGQAVSLQNTKEVLAGINPKDLVSPEDFVRVLEAKEGEITRLTSLQNNLRDELASLNAELGKLNIQFDRIKTEQKSAEKKLSAAEFNADNEKVHNRTLEKKLQTISHLLKESHKTISKLNGITENLKTDRQKYIVETNKALNKFRDMTSKALSLQRNSDANEQRAGELTKKYEMAKKKELELKKEVNKLNATVKSLKKKIKIFLDKTNGSAEGSDAA